VSRQPASRLLAKLRYELDAFTIIEIVFPLFMLVFFLLLPVLSTFEAAAEYRLSNLLGKNFWNPWEPTGQGVRLIGGGQGVTRIVVEGWNFGVILNSILNAAFVTLMASILGVVVAFVLARYEFPGKPLLRVMAIIPLLVTPFVNAYVLKKIFGPTFGTNTLSWFLHDVLHLPIYIEVRDLAGVAFTQIITFYPIVYLNMFSALLNIDPSLEEQAENLGSRGFKLFRTITFPLALPGLAAGAALVFIFSLEDVGAPIIFGFRDVLSYRIFAYFIGLSAGVRSPETGALALVMLLIALSVFVGIRQYVSLSR
jgi:iron(III) transport system permease protein